MAASRREQQEVVQCAADIWASSPQHLAITVERLMSHKVVENFAIVDWVFAHWSQALHDRLPADLGSASTFPHVSAAGGRGGPEGAFVRGGGV